MRFLLYNIRYATGHGLQYHLPLPFAGFFRPTCAVLSDIVSFVRDVDPDVVALVEVDSGSYRSQSLCQVSTIAQELGYFHVVECKYGEQSLVSKTPILKKQGNGLLSRERIVRHHFHYFREGMKRLVIEVELTEIAVFIVHLSLMYRHRQQQLEQLYRIVHMSKKPVIVAGDFNTFGGGREVQLFLAATGLVDANIGGLPSHPSHAPKRNLDFILHSPQLKGSNFSIPDIRFSDHAPLICDFSLT